MSAPEEREGYHLGVDLDDPNAKVFRAGYVHVSGEPEPSSFSRSDADNLHGAWNDFLNALRPVVDRLTAMVAGVTEWLLGSGLLTSAQRRELRRTETPARSARHAEYRRKTRHRRRNRAGR